MKLLKQVSKDRGGRRWLEGRREGRWPSACPSTAPEAPVPSCCGLVFSCEDTLVSAVTSLLLLKMVEAPSVVLALRLNPCWAGWVLERVCRLCTRVAPGKGSFELVGSRAERGPGPAPLPR